MKRIERKRVSDQIIEQLLASLRNGRLKIGDKLPSERVLMEKFDVGRNSIREAVGALSFIGVLDVRPGRGTRIIGLPSTQNINLENITKWDMVAKQDKVQDLIQARIYLEQTLVEVAIEKANKKDIQELNRIMDFLKASAENKRDRQKYIQADLAFHMALASATHNDILIRFHSEIRHSMLNWMEWKMASFNALDMRNSLREHIEILKAIEAKDVEEAKLKIREHLGNSGMRKVGHS